MKIFGNAILIIGLGMTIFSTITYFTREKVLQIGTVELTANHPHYLNWSPFLGTAIMVVGAFVVLQSKKK